MPNNINVLKDNKPQNISLDFNFKTDFEKWFKEPYFDSTLTIDSGCKINLYLYITDILKNGYHSLETLFIPLKLPQDKLVLSLKNINHNDISKKKFNLYNLHFSSSDQQLNIENNTLTKTFTIYQQARNIEETNIQLEQLPTLNLYLEKNVPQGAGLGGSSANAASLLLFLELFSRQKGLKPFSNKKLIELASQVGADVALFLFNQSAVATGIGDKLKFIPNPLKNFFVLLVYPNIKISTPWAYSEYDKTICNNMINLNNKKNIQKNNKILYKVLTKEKSLAISLFSQGIKFFNDFEPVIFAQYPELLDLKNNLLGLGADFATMSGSGSSIFGVFHSEKEAIKSYKLIKKKYNSTFLQCI